MSLSDPRDPQLWKDFAQALADADALRETVMAAGYSDDAAELLTISAERAALASLDRARYGLIAPAVSEGAVCGTAATLCAARKEGEAVVQFADGRQRAFAAGGRSGMNAPRWALALGLASCADAADAMNILTHPRAVLACQEPPEIADDFWTGYCLALSALYGNDPAAADLLRSAIAGLACEYLRIADVAYVEATRTPVLRLALSLAEGGNDREGKLSSALTAHVSYYGEGAGKGERLGLLAFELAGLCSLARRRGLDIKTDAALLAALSGLPASQPGVLEFRFPPLRLLHDGEAHWFLDLQGFPRDRRTHEIVEQDGILQARYHAEGASGLPRALTRFALTGEGLKTSDWPLALDAGQLIHLHGLMLGVAEEWLKAGAGHEESLRTCLAEAATLREAIELRLPPEGQPFDVSSLRSALGRETWEKMPQAFSREWLEEEERKAAVKLSLKRPTR